MFKFYSSFGKICFAAVETNTCWGNEGIVSYLIERAAASTCKALAPALNALGKPLWKLPLSIL